MKNKDQIFLESLYNKVIQEQMDDIGDDQHESEYELRTDVGDEETSIEDIEAKLENEKGSEEEETPEVEGEAETPLEKEAEEELPEDAPDEGLTDDQVDLFSQLIKQEN